MGRLNDANALFDTAKHIIGDCASYKARAIADAITNAPTIEAEPVRRGRWLPHPTEKDWRVCSACGQGTEIVRHEAGATTEYSYKHCPWCGTKLEVEND